MQVFNGVTFIGLDNNDGVDAVTVLYEKRIQELNL